MGRGGLAQGCGTTPFAFGGADGPLATAHSDPLWVGAPLQSKRRAFSRQQPNRQTTSSGRRAQSLPMATSGLQAGTSHEGGGGGGGGRASSPGAQTRKARLKALPWGGGGGVLRLSAVLILACAHDVTQPPQCQGTFLDIGRDALGIGADVLVPAQLTPARDDVEAPALREAAAPPRTKDGAADGGDVRVPHASRMMALLGPDPGVVELSVGVQKA